MVFSALSTAKVISERCLFEKNGPKGYIQLYSKSIFWFLEKLKKTKSSFSSVFKVMVMVMSTLEVSVLDELGSGFN